MSVAEAPPDCQGAAATKNGRASLTSPKSAALIRVAPAADNPGTLPAPGDGDGQSSYRMTVVSLP